MLVAVVEFCEQGAGGGGCRVHQNWDKIRVWGSGLVGCLAVGSS